MILNYIQALHLTNRYVAYDLVFVAEIQTMTLGQRLRGELSAVG